MLSFTRLCGRRPLLLQASLTLMIIALSRSVETLRVEKECDYGRTSSPADANPKHFVGGMFSAHQINLVKKDAATQCSLGNPELFHRFGVEQMEALIFATELVNMGTDNGTSDFLGYSIYDTCGDLPPLARECAEQQAKALASPDNLKDAAVATVVGPFYREQTIKVSEDKLKDIYESPVRGVLSLVDEPIDLLSGETVSSLKNVVYMQPNCKLQARAAVDFVVAVGWHRVSVVASDDGCGLANLEEFDEAIKRKQVECSIMVEYYSGNERNTFAAPNIADISKFFSSSTLWRENLNPSRPIVFLGSIPYAVEFFEHFIDDLQGNDKDSYQFLVGDFWGGPNEIDKLYSILKRVVGIARILIALRTATNGLEKFQQHMASIRANSTEIQRNSILKRYWEVYFNCSIANETCNNESALPAVNRPILRNYKSPLVIDSVFLLAAYVKAFQQKYPTQSVEFNTKNAIFVEGHPQTVTNVSSWTGNQVRVGPVAGRPQDVVTVSTGPVTWSFDFLVLTENVNEALQFGTWTYYGRNEEGNNTLVLDANRQIDARLNTSSLPVNLCVVTPTPTPSPLLTHTSTSTSEPKDPDSCSSEDIIYVSALAVSIFVLFLHLTVLFLSLCFFGLVSTCQRIVPLPAIFLFVLTLSSILLSMLVAVQVFSPFDCDNLGLDFFINVLTVLSSPSALWKSSVTWLAEVSIVFLSKLSLQLHSSLLNLSLHLWLVFNLTGHTTAKRTTTVLSTVSSHAVSR
eukprot:m.148693 g.148693  ORF g.148693 m.148693 type:complete len:746 (+) comp38504_c0_seq1:98-2335(+)